VELLRRSDECVTAVLQLPVRNLLQQLLKKRLHPGTRLLVDRCDDRSSIRGEVAYESGDLLLIGTLTERKKRCGGWSGAARRNAATELACCIVWVTTLGRCANAIRRGISLAVLGSCCASICCTERCDCMQRGARPPPCGENLLRHCVICNHRKEFGKPADWIGRVRASGATNCSDACRELSDPCGV
jgi:hypothetical protein